MLVCSMVEKLCSTGLTSEHREEKDTKGPYIAGLPIVQLSRENLWGNRLGRATGCFAERVCKLVLTEPASHQQQYYGMQP